MASKKAKAPKLTKSQATERIAKSFVRGMRGFIPPLPKGLGAQPKLTPHQRLRQVEGELDQAKRDRTVLEGEKGALAREVSCLSDHSARVRSLETVQVVKLKLVRGSGSPSNVVREVVQYWTPEGELLVEKDPCPRGTRSAFVGPQAEQAMKVLLKPTAEFASIDGAVGPEASYASYGRVAIARGPAPAKERA